MIDETTPKKLIRTPYSILISGNFNALDLIAVGQLAEHLKLRGDVEIKISALEKIEEEGNE